MQQGFFMDVSNLKKHFGDQLKQCLKKSDVRQIDVASALGISPSAVSQMLAGRIIPKLGQLDVIMQLLSLDRCECADLRDCLARIRSGDEELRSPLNDFIKSSRTKCGLSIEKLSEMSGIPAENLMMLENRLNIQPTPYEAVRLAAIFNCSVGDLWQVVPDKPGSVEGEKNPQDSVLEFHDHGAPYRRAEGNQNIKVPVIRLEDLCKYNAQHDRLIDFSWRHMVSFERNLEVGMVIVQAPGRALNWPEMYDAKVVVCDVKHWLPGMSVLALRDGEIKLGVAGDNINMVNFAGTEEVCACEYCWMVCSCSFESDLFVVTDKKSGENK